MRQLFLLAIFGFLCAIAASGCRSTGSAAAKDEATIADTVTQGRTALEQGKYKRARRLVRPVADRVPPTAKSAEAAFLVAESYRLGRNRSRALTAYRKYVERFPISEHLGEAEDHIFSIALDYLEGRIRTGFGLFSHRARGVAALEFILESFPRGHKAPEAQRVLADYHYRRGRWIEAAAEYTELLQRFARSEWRSVALYRIGMCYIRQSRGPEYDPALLDRARIEFVRYAETYPEGSKIDEVRERIAKIDDALAQKTLDIARYYERNAERPAAEMYYRETVERYPDSAFAVEARRSLEKMKGAR